MTYDGEEVKVFLSPDLVEPILSAKIGGLESTYWFGFTGSASSDGSNVIEHAYVRAMCAVLVTSVASHARACVLICTGMYVRL